MDKEGTNLYVSQHMMPDIRYQHYLLQKDLYGRGCAMQPVEPVYSKNNGEIAIETALETRDELFGAIRTDGSFGYLFFILGTEHNSRFPDTPVDCIPDEEHIRKCICDNRDNYPQANLDGFINDELNYSQYCKLLDTGFLDDNDEKSLAYFNRAYEIFDHLRLKRHSIGSVRQYLRELRFDNDEDKYWTLDLCAELAARQSDADASLERCRMEIGRILSAQKSHVPPAGEPSQAESPVFLNTRRGMRIDFIRVLNAMYEIGMFTGKNGEPISKKEFMATFGKAANIDLTKYDNDLSRALSDSTALEKHLRVFDDLRQKMTDIFNSH